MRMHAWWTFCQYKEVIAESDALFGAKDKLQIQLEEWYRHVKRSL